jgi:heme exporter protein A
LLAVEGLACRRGGRLVFEAVAFALEAGDALVLSGANGTGKTSLLRLLAGFARPAEGSVTWLGRDIADEPAEHAQRVHFLGFADAVEGLLSVRENLVYLAALLGGRTDTLDSALAAFDLGELADRPARELSAGQRRRVALARLLAVPRPLWLLDEPGVALDRANRARLEAAIERQRDAGGLVVVATHGDVRVRDPLVLELGEPDPC